MSEELKPIKTKRNYRNSPVIGDGGITASPAEVSVMTQYAREVFEAKQVDLDDPEAVKSTIIAYFNRCGELGLRPGNLGMYAALGLSKQDVSNAIHGYSRKLSPQVIDVIKKGKLALGTFRESLALSGKLNPVTAIFWGKNFDQMSDTHEISVSQRDTLTATNSPEEIDEMLKRVELDIPVDDFDENEV